MNPHHLYAMEYLLYHLKPYGLGLPFVKRPNSEEIRSTKDLTESDLLLLARSHAGKHQGADDWMEGNKERLLDRLKPK